jgi:hypothetical protein
MEIAMRKEYVLLILIVAGFGAFAQHRCPV